MLSPGPPPSTWESQPAQKGAGCYVGSMFESMLSKLSKAGQCLSSVFVPQSLCHTTLLTALPDGSLPTEQGTRKQLFFLGTIGYNLDGPVPLEFFASQ